MDRPTYFAMVVSIALCVRGDGVIGVASYTLTGWLVLTQDSTMLETALSPSLFTGSLTIVSGPDFHQTLTRGGGPHCPHSRMIASLPAIYTEHVTSGAGVSTMQLAPMLEKHSLH
jgi:hypothetical protein